LALDPPKIDIFGSVKRPGYSPVLDMFWEISVELPVRPIIILNQLLSHE
jgi:hypothetical protein